MDDEIVQSLKQYFGDDTYNKNVENNYMFHEDYLSIIKEKYLNNSKDNLDILDLGCGNGLFSSSMLRNCHINSYTGVDISDYFLELAKNNLSFITKTNFVSQDVLDFLMQNKKTFDIVISSFCIHHFNFESKEKIFNLIKTSLKKDGKFIFIDEYMEENSNRKDFLYKYTNHIKTWVKYTNAEYTNTITHVETCDFPEKISTYINMWNAEYNILNKFDFQVNMTFFK